MAEALYSPDTQRQLRHNALEPARRAWCHARDDGATMYLVERDAQLEILHDRLRQATSGAGHLALVAGEAGIGKTSLLEALRARSGDVRVWWGACDALQTPHPLAPLHDIARDSAPDLRALLGDGDRVALFEGVLTQLQRGPTLFVVEDAHWADAATLDLLKFLGRRIGRTPCLLVVSYRDDEVGATHPLRRLMGELPASVLTRIDVPPLTSAGVDALAQRALRGAAGLHAITRGNPFFVTELLRQGIDGVPRGVQDLVLARFARLSREAQDIVRLASVVPARIERRVIDELLTPDATALEECLDSGLLVAVPGALAFRHELARVAVESALSAPAAQALHACVLRTLLHVPAVSLARVVHHATHAGDTAAVLRHAPQAAQQAAQRGAHKEAAAHLRTALEHAAALSDVEQAELFDRLSYECYLTERIADAIAARESALARWRAVDAEAKAGDALRWLSRLNWYHGNSGAARDYAEQAISVLQTLPPGRELAMAYSNRSQLHMLAGEGDAARAWGAKAIALASEIGDLETQIHALNNIGTAKCAEGDASGIADLERSLALALEHGYEEHAARAYTNLGYDTGAKGDYAKADAYLERGIAFCEPRDLESWTRYMSAYRCEVALWQGDFARAAERTEHVLRLPGLAPVSRMLALMVQGRLRARRGEANALEPLDEALALALPTAEFMRVGPVAAARAEAAWLRGDRQAIGPEIATAWHFFQGTTYLSWVVGELAWWQHRGCGSDKLGEDVLRHCAEPFALQIAGRWRDAAVAWAARGCPYERARALADGDSQAQLEALAEFERLGARVDAERLRKILQEAGVRGVPRGQRASTQAHPHALTAREAQVLELLCAGMKNADIAARLSRSVRTIDHHVAAIIAKLGVASRAEAIAAALRAGLAAPK
jgi:DNA-binding CsgD family transcriptional regulator/tetratricopeptide (TPR) repeat protein